MSKVSFNVDAYTAKLIGRENVSRLDGAVLELVKNTYDADATMCFIYYEKETSTLYIGDNGIGMTKDIILKHWMTIGSSSKKLNYKTKKGRIQTGAKGIGRFALDRIADNCSMITVSDEVRLLWNVDWSSFVFGQSFTDITADLDYTQITFVDFLSDVNNKNVVTCIKENFGETGSIFKLTNLRDNWDNETIESIVKNLRTLIPPEFKEIFNIYLFKSDTKMEDAALLQESDDFSYDYKIEFEVSESGKVKVILRRDEFDFGDRFDEIMCGAGFNQEQQMYFTGTSIIKELNFSDVLGGKSKVDNSIGMFNGTFYYAKINSPKREQEKYFYKDITGRPDIRDSFGGIRIYRDGFRVRPYGEPKSSAEDWLRLSWRKNKSPASVSHRTGAWRVNSDQIHPSIHISRTNITFPDQANRQGIVETKEFILLQEFLQNIIKIFEQDRQWVCRKLNAYYEETPHTEEIQKEIEEKLKTEKKNQEENLNQQYIPESIDVKKVSVLMEAKNSEIQDLETELQMLRVLATTGIVTNTYIHEIKSITHKLSMAILTAKEALQYDNNTEEALLYLKQADELRQFFTSWFKVTVEAVRRDKRRMHVANLNKLLNDLIDQWKRALAPDDIEIEYEIPEVRFKCFPYEIESIINNLISNSASAFLKRKFDHKIISIRIEQVEDGILIKYKDNGEGLQGNYKKNPKLILEAFESDKRVEGQLIGTGMGMWIVNRIVNDYNGTLDLDKNKTETSGFWVDIILKSKK